MANAHEQCAEKLGQAQHIRVLSRPDKDIRQGRNLLGHSCSNTHQPLTTNPGARFRYEKAQKNAQSVRIARGIWRKRSPPHSNFCHHKPPQMMVAISVSPSEN